MDSFINIFSDIRKATALAVGLHLILALLLILWKINFDFNPPEYSEVAFIASTEQVQPAKTKETVTPQPSRAAPKRETPTPKEATTETPENAVPVDLPKRRMAEEESPEIAERKADKLAPAQQGEKLPVRRETQSEQRVEAPTTRSTGEKISPGAQNLALSGAKTSPTSENLSGGTAQMQPYTIEGEAADRTVLKKVIPDYPENLQKEAVVKIRFTVLPDGRVGQMIPVQKDDPRLENITMEALRQWRFNPLSQSTEQRSVKGVITFRYELK